MARSMAEEGKVSVRNVRRDEMRDVHELRREGEVSEAEVRALPEPLRMVQLAGSTPFYDLLRTKASLLPY